MTPDGSCPTTSSPSPTPGRGWPCCRRSTRPRWAGRSATSTSAEPRAEVFDRNGNGGTTAWCNGRDRRCWVPDADGRVEVVLAEDVRARRPAARSTRRPTAHGAGSTATWSASIYASRQMREASCRSPARLLTASRAAYGTRDQPEQQAPPGPAAARALRQARPPALHQPPRLQPGLRAGRRSAPASRWPTRRASTRTRASPTPAPRRPGPPARRSTSRSALAEQRRPRPTSRAGSTRRCPPGSTSSRSSRSPGGSLADRLEASRWQIDARTGRPGRRRAPRSTAFLAADAVAVERMTKKGLRDLRQPRGRARAVGRAVVRRGGRRSTWSCDTPSPPSGPTTCCPACAAVGGLDGPGRRS